MFQLLVSYGSQPWTGLLSADDVSEDAEKFESFMDLPAIFVATGVDRCLFLI